MITFLYPLYFLLIIPLIFLIILLYFYWWKKVYFKDNYLLKKIFKVNTKYYKIYHLLVFWILFLFILILANPVVENIIEKNNKKWIDIQIILDVSWSMSATDLKPNRLEVAKNSIDLFVKEIKTDRLWLIVFSWKTFTSIPLNFDYKIINKILSKVNLNTIDQWNFSMQWTAIWDALLHAWEWFNEKERGKVIILLTDWVANKWINPLAAVTYLKENLDKDIKIYTIWIWTLNNDSEIPWLDEDTLKKISFSTNWKYFRATNNKALENILLSISDIEKTEIETDVIKTHKTRYNFFIYSMILLFLLLLIVKYKKNL